jgi:hypothetical protein
VDHTKANSKGIILVTTAALIHRNRNHTSIHLSTYSPSLIASAFCPFPSITPKTARANAINRLLLSFHFILQIHPSTAPTITLRTISIIHWPIHQTDADRPTLTNTLFSHSRCFPRWYAGASTQRIALLDTCLLNNSLSCRNWYIRVMLSRPISDGLQGTRTIRRATEITTQVSINRAQIAWHFEGVSDYSTQALS